MSELQAAVDEIVLKTVKEHFGSYVQQELFGWNNQLFKPMLQSAVSKLKGLPVMLATAMEEVLSEAGFKEKLKDALRNRLVNDMVKSFNLQEAMKAIKSDPAMGKKIIDALQEFAAVPKEA